MATTQSKPKTDSEAKVAAREQLDQLEQPRDQVSTLRDQADEQEKRQADELKAGTKGGETKDGETLAHNRAPESGPDSGVQGGRVDQWTRRDSRDALENHFVTVDRTHKDVDESLFADGEDGYGVYIEPVTVGEDTYPKTARVRLTGSPNVTHVFPYEALRPASPRGR